MLDKRCEIVAEAARFVAEHERNVSLERVRLPSKVALVGGGGDDGPGGEGIAELGWIVGREEGEVEERSHGGTDGLGVEGVDAWLDEDDGVGANGVGGADQGAAVAGVLEPIENEDE